MLLTVIEIGPNLAQVLVGLAGFVVLILIFIIAMRD